MSKTEHIEQSSYYDMLLRKRYIQLNSFTEHFPEECASYVEVPVPTLREVMTTLRAARSHIDNLTQDLRESS